MLSLTASKLMKGFGTLFAIFSNMYFNRICCKRQGDYCLSKCAFDGRLAAATKPTCFHVFLYFHFFCTQKRQYNFSLLKQNKGEAKTESWHVRTKQ